jgi:hypothetical protein
LISTAQIAIDAATGRPLRGKLRHVLVDDGPGRRLAEQADRRRAERLEDKRVLLAMYGGGRT